MAAIQTITKLRHKIIDSGLQQFTFDAGRSHQSKYNGYTARTDADGKRDGIKYLLFYILPFEAIHVPARFFLIWGVRIGRATPWPFYR